MSYPQPGNTAAPYGFYATSEGTPPEAQHDYPDEWTPQQRQRSAHRQEQARRAFDEQRAKAAAAAAGATDAEIGRGVDAIRRYLEGGAR